MKKLISVLLVIIIAFTFVCCKDDTSDETATNYTVSFDSGIESQTIESGAKATAPTDPTKAGYTFGGWLNGETAFNFDTAITANVSLTAKWTAIEYTITYVVGDGCTHTNPAKYTIETDDITLANPTAPTGKTFTEWQIDGSPVTKIAKGSTGNKTITASYADIVTYTVSFDSDVTAQTIVSGAKAIEPTAPTKTGYDFGGWFDGTDTFNFDTVAITANISLTAKWTPIEYTITYVVGDGTNNASNPATYTIETDDITLAAPTAPTGKTFTQWQIDGSPVTKIAKGSTGNKTITAIYVDIVTYTVTFDSGVLTQTIESGAKATEPTAPTKAGYTFGGWFDGETEFYFDTVAITANISLTAKWTAIEYTITYVVGDGTNNASNPATYTIETDDITLSNPTAPTGKYFAGWKNGEAAISTISKGSTGNLTITATYTDVAQFVVSFVSDGTEISAAYVAEGSKVTAPTTPTKTGYDFGGWLKGTDTFDFNTTITAAITLTAKWTIKTYTITYVVGDGCTHTNPATYTVETDDITLAAPTAPTGKAFVEWKKGDTAITTIAKGSTGDLTITAIYKGDITCSITLPDQSTANSDYDPEITADSLTFFKGDSIEVTAALSTAAPTGFTYDAYSWSLRTVGGTISAGAVTNANTETVTIDTTKVTSGTYNLIIVVTASDGNKYSSNCTIYVE